MTHIHSADHGSPDRHRNGFLQSRASPVAKRAGSPDTQGAPEDAQADTRAPELESVWWPLFAALGPSHSHGT